VAKWNERSCPLPEFTDIQDVERIVDWVEEKKREGKACYIKTVASNATRIARAAWDKGVSLEGTKFRVSGEPFTEAKRSIIEQAGASAIPHYGSNAAGTVGLGCAKPVYTDDLHALEHRLAVVLQPNPLPNGGLPIQPLLFTTLSPQDARLLLNVDNGDCAELERRDCGCGLARIGLTLHLHHIRSYEKFTSEGMNYFYGDLMEVFEKHLPAEFGGGPGDYQLVEEEDSQGQTRISVIVHPGVENLDEERLLSRLRVTLGDGSRGNRFMAELWQAAGTFRVLRKPPHASGRGKILPLHISQERRR
jgi:phenylacetate-coenzyme A ligase PaaK-like adenylate-forming protein